MFSPCCKQLTSGNRTYQCEFECESEENQSEKRSLRCALTLICTRGGNCLAASPARTSSKKSSPRYTWFFFVFHASNSNLRSTGRSQTKKPSHSTWLFSYVPGAGIEPARPQWPQDFKSCVSTNSTTRAGKGCKGIIFL